MSRDFNELIKLIKQKDELAFEEVYFMTNKMVYSIIISITKDEDVTEDLMQDTYIKMVKNINQFQAGYNFKTWLGTIARNLAIDYYRRNQREYVVDISLEEQQFFETTEKNLDLEAEAFELLDTLTSDEQLIVLLRVIDELTFREIAEITERPLGTVIWSYNNSIKKLSKMYKGGADSE